MNIELLLVGVLPIVLFVFIEQRYGPKAGIYAAIAIFCALGVWYYLRFGEFDTLLLVDGILIVGLGILSIRLQNTKYFKMQPFAVSFVSFLYLTYLQVFDTPVLLRYLPSMQKLSPELSTTLARIPDSNLLFTKLSLYLIYVFALHAGIMFYTALRCNSWVWMGARLSIYPLMFAAIVFVMSSNA